MSFIDKIQGGKSRRGASKYLKNNDRATRSGYVTSSLCDGRSVNAYASVSVSFRLSLLPLTMRSSVRMYDLDVSAASSS